MSQTTRSFPLRTALSITTGIAYCTSMDDLNSLVGHITGDEIFTHQMVRAGAYCTPVITAQHPALPTEGPSSDNATPEQIEEWLHQMEATHGTHLDITSQPEGWQVRNPVEELAELIGHDKPIYVVSTDSDPASAARNIAEAAKNHQAGTNS